MIIEQCDGQPLIPLPLMPLLTLHRLHRLSRAFKNRQSEPPPLARPPRTVFQIAMPTRLARYYPVEFTEWIAIEEIASQPYMADQPSRIVIHDVKMLSILLVITSFSIDLKSIVGRSKPMVPLPWLPWYCYPGTTAVLDQYYWSPAVMLIQLFN